MWASLTRRRNIIVWQFLFILLNTSWLWAPYLNQFLSARTSLISQYESPHEAYSLFFRVCDVLGGLLLLYIARLYIQHKQKIVGYLLLAIGVGFVLDPLLTTTCQTTINTCEEYLSTGFVLHAIETVATTILLVSLTLYDAWVRKKLVSIGFATFQVLYGLLFMSQLASRYDFNTLSQYLYQTMVVIWLAWFCRDYLTIGDSTPTKEERKVVKNTMAVWAFLNGIFAILISLTHIRLFGRFRGFYFAGDSPWLAQHGVIIGVVLIYVARHLARGEMRARQIFMAIAGLEALKYAVITPNAELLLLYFVTFVLLFIFRDDFDRGIVPLTWQIRLRDLYYLVIGLLLAIGSSLIILDRDNRISAITTRAFNGFYDYIAQTGPFGRSAMRSGLLAHTASVFLGVSVAAILWVLFRPNPRRTRTPNDYTQVEAVLKNYSTSTEDYFKLWPHDKEFFWQTDREGFVAYKQSGSVAFGLADPVSLHPKTLIKSFMEWCKANRLKVCFLPAQRTSEQFYKDAGFETVQIGSTAVIDVEHFATQTMSNKWWRWQRNRSEKAGYVYASSIAPHTPFFLNELKVVSDAWLTKDGREERGFALGYFDPAYIQSCTIHYLRDAEGKMVAFTNLLPQFKSFPTVTVDLLRHLPEANNAMSYLLAKTIEATHNTENNITKFDLGFVPFAKAKGPVLTITKLLGSTKFSSKGLEQFKNKFEPDWQPIFLAYEGDLGDLANIALKLEQAMQQD